MPGGSQTSRYRAVRAPIEQGLLRQVASFLGGGGASLRRVELLPRILHVGDRLKLNVGKFTVPHLRAPHVNVLDDIARVGIDRDRPAWAVGVLPALEDC